MPITVFGEDCVEPDKTWDTEIGDEGADVGEDVLDVLDILDTPGVGVVVPTARPGPTPGPT
ncbi:hypothetical protein, partial [Catenulispora rubra]|uniref:hypothetical protein n=1 Tax=Catenulispora rubra TaxID=280293 RepID=UPI001E32E0BB